MTSRPQHISFSNNLESESEYGDGFVSDCVEKRFHDQINESTTLPIVDLQNLQGGN